MAFINLNGLEFYAFHGCSEEEKKVGIWFNVDISIEYPSERAEYTDELSKALNYQEIYYLVAEQMQQTSNLLENVAYRIREKIIKKFLTVTKVVVKISKLNPPLGGKVNSVSVQVEFNKQQ